MRHTKTKVRAKCKWPKHTCTTLRAVAQDARRRSTYEWVRSVSIHIYLHNPTRESAGRQASHPSFLSLRS